MGSQRPSASTRREFTRDLAVAAAGSGVVAPVGLRSREGAPRAHTIRSAMVLSAVGAALVAIGGCGGDGGVAPEPTTPRVPEFRKVGFAGASAALAFTPPARVVTPREFVLTQGRALQTAGDRQLPLARFLEEACEYDGASGRLARFCRALARDHRQLGEAFRASGTDILSGSGGGPGMERVAQVLTRMARRVGDFGLADEAEAMGRAAEAALTTAHDLSRLNGSDAADLRVTKSVLRLGEALREVANAQAAAPGDFREAASVWPCPGQDHYYLGSTTYHTRRLVAQSAGPWHKAVGNAAPIGEQGVYYRRVQYTVTYRWKTASAQYCSYLAAFWAWGGQNYSVQRGGPRSERTWRYQWYVAFLEAPEDSYPMPAPFTEDYITKEVKRIGRPVHGVVTAAAMGGADSGPEHLGGRYSFSFRKMN